MCTSMCNKMICCKMTIEFSHLTSCTIRFIVVVFFDKSIKQKKKQGLYYVYSGQFVLNELVKLNTLLVQSFGIIFNRETKYRRCLHLLNCKLA